MDEVFSGEQRSSAIIASGSQQSYTWSTVVRGRHKLPTATYDVYNHLHRLQPPTVINSTLRLLHVCFYIDAAIYIYTYNYFYTWTAAPLASTPSQNLDNYFSGFQLSCLKSWWQALALA